ncbi:MAG TPA: hypothetical protein VGR78_10385, partial [Verrucomicrobiae bacterium]|nr:hypothetical protein [Verrucomicrobiae bacterium]
ARTTQKFLYSHDGTNWTSIRVPPNVSPFGFVGGAFIGLLDGTNVVSSSDGLVWLERDAVLPEAKGFLFGAGTYLAYGQGIFQSDPVNQILSITHAKDAGGGDVSTISVFGLIDRRYVLEGSTNLVDWSMVSVINSSPGTAVFRLTNSAPTAVEFYRSALY